jgi:formylglycine-generating enzyme required for sulfatase activity
MLAVGSLKPNDWGLFDVLGNALEWAQDRPRYYTSQRGGKAMDDRELMEPISDRNIRALRGGSFVDRALSVRSAHRLRGAPLPLYGYGGFRVARTFDGSSLPHYH